jgi:hypothetical protein
MGKPGDIVMQKELCSLTLDTLEKAFTSQMTVHAPHVWSDDNRWRANYMRVDDSTRAGLAAAGAARKENQQQAKADRSPHSTRRDPSARAD